MQLKLKVMKGSSAGREFPVRNQKCLIGREKTCHIVAKSDLVSRQHCAITIEENEVFIEDLKSRNGTVVNGEKIEGKRQLTNGDAISIGPLHFEIVLSDAPVKEKEKVEDTVAEKLPIQDTAIERKQAPAAEKPKPVSSPRLDFDDSDITDWLEEADEVDQMERLAEPDTRQFRLDETDHIDLEETETDPKKKKGKKEKPEPMKLPQQQRDLSKDSQEAASDMLKKFFTRR